MAASRPKALAMADGRTIAKLRLTMPPEDTNGEAAFEGLNTMTTGQIGWVMSYGIETQNH
ncbi:MAG: hypothetical protein A2Y77_06530 [Planctomycetes bacterium RBG_13_62_9]|nr:MAG: hypothetical protein A2Y77_06530 [Planctomycetes bacterium RBG_13_62_9]